MECIGIVEREGGGTYRLIHPPPGTHHVRHAAELSFIDLERLLQRFPVRNVCLVEDDSCRRLDILIPVPDRLQPGDGVAVQAQVTDQDAASSSVELLSEGEADPWLTAIMSEGK